MSSHHVTTFLFIPFIPSSTSSSSSSFRPNAKRYFASSRDCRFIIHRSHRPSTISHFSNIILKRGRYGVDCLRKSRTGRRGIHYSQEWRVIDRDA
jgi:hypothetical protein